MIKAYKYRILPTEEQEVFLEKHFGCVRKMYNLALDLKQKSYKEGVKISCYDIKKLIPVWKEEFEYLKEVNSSSLQQSILNLDNAFKRFYKKQGGYPKFKSKHNSKNSFSIPSNTKVDVEKKLVKIPKFLEGIKCVFHRSIPEKSVIKSSTISKESNAYYISINVEIPEKAIVEMKTTEETTLGIDLGIKDFLIDSNGNKESNPKFLKTSLPRLKRLQKKLSKSKALSKNRIKRKIKVAKLHKKVANQRRDFLHKISHKIANDNQVGTVVLESLVIKNMVRNHFLSKAIVDVSWGRFIQYLAYKLYDKGKQLIRIDTFFPSSKTCSKCNHKKDKLSLSERIYHCNNCNTYIDRDINAAINIKNQGIRIISSTVGITGIKACGDNVRHESNHAVVIESGSILQKVALLLAVGSSQANIFKWLI